MINGHHLKTQSDGETAVLKVQLRALEKGYIISTPTIDARYDLIIDTHDKLLKAQIKYNNRLLRCGAIGINLYKKRQFTNKMLVYTANEIDLFLVYVFKIDKILAFNEQYLDGRHHLNVRLKPRQQESVKEYMWYEDFIW